MSRSDEKKKKRSSHGRRRITSEQSRGEEEEEEKSDTWADPGEKRSSREADETQVNIFFVFFVFFWVKALIGRTDQLVTSSSLSSSRTLKRDEISLVVCLELPMTLGLLCLTCSKQREA